MNFKVPKNLDLSVIAERIKQPLSDADLERYFGAGKESEVIKYNELANYKTIDELLPKPFDFRIILVETAHNIGHWVLILKYGNTIENFNSYGIDIDRQKNMLCRIANFNMGQSKNLLTKLVGLSPYKYIVNKIPFQDDERDTNTCGRWVALRIITAKDMFMPLDDFTRMIIKATKELGMTPDQLVSMWID
jgi:hypothetical protein